MALIITSQINASTGDLVSNAYMEIIAHTDHVLQDGKVDCDLLFWYSLVDKNKNKDKFTPVILKDDNTIRERVRFATVQLTEAEVIGVNLPAKIYEKVATYLNTSFGWLVTAA